MILWFGEHEGKELADVPTDYLEFLVSKTEPPSRATTKEQRRQQRSQWMDLLAEAESLIEERAD